MKILSILFLAVTLVNAKAATGLSSPVLTNFNKQSFLVDLEASPTNVIKINPDLVGVTNLTVTNINTTTINASTNVYQSTVYIGITNFNTYLTTNNFVINGTNVATQGDLLWTNISGVLQPIVGNSVNVTNVTANTVLAATGAFIIRDAFTTNLVAGDNNINPNNASRILVNGFDSTPTNSTVNLSSGNGSGTFLYIVNYTALGSSFCIYDGTSMWDGGGILSLPNGNWCPTRPGETLVLQNAGINGWQEVGRFGGGVPSGDSLWLTNFASASISPKVAPTLMTVNTNGSIGIGLTNVFYDKDIGIFHRADLEGNRKAWINIGAASSYPFTNDWGSEWWANTGTNDGVMTLSWLQLPAGTGTQRDHVWTAGASGNFFYYQTKKDGVATFEVNGENGDLTTSGVFNFGFSETNVLMRSGTDLVYSNKYQYPNIRVQGSGASPALFGVNASTLGDAAQVSGPKGVNLGWDVGQVAFYSTNAVPNTFINLGTASKPFGGSYHYGPVDVYGYNQGNLIDYSNLRITHTGTNGAVMLDSQSAGIAGDPRPFSFQFNGTSLLNLSSSGGTTLVLENPTDHNMVFKLNGGNILLDQTTATGSPAVSFYPGLIQQNRNSIGSTVPVITIGATVSNSEFATASQQQNSPAVSWTGQGWGTNSATSQVAGFGSYVVPSAGADTPTARLNFSSVLSNTTPSIVFAMDSQGPIKLVKGITKAQKSLIVPENGMIVYQTDNTPGLRAYINGAWVMLSTVADP